MKKTIKLNHEPSSKEISGFVDCKVITPKGGFTYDKDGHLSGASINDIRSKDEECELCGETFVQKTMLDKGNYPRTLNLYCDKCTRALKNREYLQKKLDQEEWIRLRKKLLKIKI